MTFCNHIIKIEILQPVDCEKISNFDFAEVEVEVKVEKKKLCQITCFHGKIRKVPGVFLNLNLNLAILKMRSDELQNFCNYSVLEKLIMHFMSHSPVQCPSDTSLRLIRS
jgi:hypothetical protein